MHQTADPFALKHAAILAARGLADGTTKATTKKKNLVSRLLEDNPLGRKVLFKKAQEQVVKTTDGHYPAPFDILDCIRAVRGLARRCEVDLLRATASDSRVCVWVATSGVQGADKGAAAGYKAEAEAFGKLGMTSVSESLRGIFFGHQKCSKNQFGKPAKEAKVCAGARRCRLTLVLTRWSPTCGVMGTDGVCVGCRVDGRWHCTSECTEGLRRGAEGQGFEGLDPWRATDCQQPGKPPCCWVLVVCGCRLVTRGTATVCCQAPRVKRRQMSSGDRDKILARVMGVTDDDASWRKHMAKSDVVIEAVFENLDLKHRVVRCTRVCGCVCSV